MGEQSEVEALAGDLPEVDWEGEARLSGAYSRRVTDARARSALRDFSGAAGGSPGLRG